jgi:hypothetical protein
VEREEIDSGARPGVTSEASEEVKALRREVAELRRANEILKTASDRFGVEPICRVLTEHGIKIAASTYYSRLACPVSAAELADAYAANTLVDLFRRAPPSVRGAQALAHRPTRRPRLGPRPGRPADGPGRDRRRPTRPTHHHDDPPEHRCTAAPGPVRPGLGHAEAAGPVVVCRLHLRVDVGQVRLRQLHHRRLLPPDPGLAGVHVQDDAAGHLGAGTGAVHPAVAATPTSPPPVWSTTPMPDPSQYTSLAFTEALTDAGIAGSIGSPWTTL